MDELSAKQWVLRGPMDGLSFVQYASFMSKSKAGSALGTLLCMRVILTQIHKVQLEGGSIDQPEWPHAERAFRRLSALADFKS